MPHPRSRWMPVVASLVLLCWGLGLWLLWRKWLGVDPAVFEADTYVQGLRHALSRGRLWPWDLTGRFWPFLLMAPGIYLHAGLGLLPTALPALVLQALAVLGTGALIGVLGSRHTRPLLGSGLALVWVLHPVSGVALAWGWSPYASAAPLLAGAALALSAERRRLALVLAVGAVLMKINVALMVGGIAVLAWSGRLDGRRSRGWGRGLALAMALWVGLVGTAFSLSLHCTGTLDQDLHLGGPAPETAGGLWTLACVLVPVVPLLGRRGWLLVAAGAGVELVYTALLNPANSGLVPAGAVVFVAAARELPGLSRPGARLALAAVLSLLAHNLLAPPRIAPLPLTPAGLAYAPDPTGAVLRDWVGALPPDAWLVAFDPASGAIGTHPGPWLSPEEWDGETRVAVLLPGGLADDLDLGHCTEVLAPAGQRGPAVVAGWCGERAPGERRPPTPALECLDGLGVDRP